MLLGSDNISTGRKSAQQVQPKPTNNYSNNSYNNYNSESSNNKNININANDVAIAATNNVGNYNMSNKQQ